MKYNSYSVSDINKALNVVKYRNNFIRVLLSSISILIIVISLSIILSTFLFPIIEMNSSSMKPLLNDGDILLTVKKNRYKQGDIIAFYYGNKILVKRVIATSGDYINIDKDNIVYVNGNSLNEDYITNKTIKLSEISYPIQINDNSYFVLSDERDNTFDSRNIDIGNISSENIIGKVIFRFYPNIRLIKEGL